MLRYGLVLLIRRWLGSAGPFDRSSKIAKNGRVKSTGAAA